MNAVSRFIEIRTTDPERVRQRRLLNILLVILVLVAVVQELIILGIIAFDLPIHPPLKEQRFRVQSYVGSVGSILLLGLIFLINRYWSGLAARLAFIVGLAAIVYSNTPDDWTLATLTYALSIPIVISAFLLSPRSSFIAAGISSVVTSVIGLAMGTGLYITPISNFFSVSGLAWFTARTLENALADWRALNLVLDQRVQDRTRELAESLSKTEAILDSTADGVIVFDNDGSATVANPAVSDLLAYPVDEIVGRNIETLMASNADSENQRVISSLLEGHKMGEPSLKFKWGARTLSASVAPVRLDSGEEIGTVTVFRDFTREAEIDRMKSTFVSLASHELRTPLNAILGYSEMLREGVYGPLSERQWDAAGRILANTRHMLSLANNLLDRAQIEAGTLMLNVVPFSPANIVNEAVSAMEVLARNKGLGLISEIGVDLPGLVSGDQHRVSQVVVNLIGNAIKFTEKGTVSVRAYCFDQDHWAVDVSDTGIGVSEEAREYIFEPFRQADESPTRRHGGAGLGLSIVKQLVEMMGGAIRLESEVGKGSAFTIILPTVLPVPEEEDRIEAGSSP